MPVGTTKSKEAIERIMGAVKSNIIFSRLNEKQLTMLQQAMMEHVVAAGSNVVTQGEKGNHVFVVDKGELDAFVKPSASADQQFVKTFGPGQMFGELALMRALRTSRSTLSSRRRTSRGTTHSDSEAVSSPTRSTRSSLLAPSFNTPAPPSPL